MHTDPCNELIQRAREYERRSKEQYHAQERGETEAWYEAIRRHFEATLLPELKRHGAEMFVEYWPAWFVVDREHELRQGVATETLYNYEYGTHGTGYICVTSRNVYLVVLQPLTEQFPLNKPSLTGFLLDALSKQMSRLRPFQNDYSWTVSPTAIQSLSIASDRNEMERIKLVTASGNWEIYQHFTGQRKEIFDALECLRSGKFSSLRPKYHVTKRPRVLSGAELLRSRTGQPVGFSFLPEALDPARAARGLQLLDLHYLAAEVAQRGGADVELDLAHAAAAHPSDPQMQELRRAFASMRHLLDRCDNADEVLDTLHVRIDRNSQLSDVYHRSVNRLNRPYFKSLHPLPDTPHPALIRTIEIGELHNPEGFSSSLCYSWGAKNNTFISGGNDGIVRIWSLLTGAVQEQFQAFEKRENHYSHGIMRLVLSPDAKTLLTLSLNQGIKAWNTDDWSLRFAIEESREIFHCAFDESGTQFAYCPYSANVVAIIDARTGRPKPHKVSFELLKHEGDTELRSFRLAPSGDWVLMQIAEGDGWVHRLVAAELSSGKELFAVKRPPVSDFQISPCGDYIVVQCAVGGAPDVWDIAVGDWVSTTSVSWGIHSSSGKFIARSLSDGTIRIHDVHSGTEFCRLGSHLAEVRSCVFSSDERLLLSMDDRHVLKLWDLAKANQPSVAPKYFISAGVGDDAQRARSCTMCAVNPADGTVIAINHSHSDGAILDSSSGHLSSRHLEPVTPQFPFPKMSELKLSQIQHFGVQRCAISASGQRALLVGGGAWAIFDTCEFQAMHSTEGNFQIYLHDPCVCAFSANHRWVAVAVRNQLMIWDLITGQTQTVTANTTIRACVFDPKSQWIIWAIGSPVDEGWDFKKLDLSTGHVTAFDKTAVSCTWPRHPQRTGNALEVFGFIRDLAISIDGSLVIAAHNWGVVSVWDAADLRLVTAWRSFAGIAEPMPDNKTVLTVASDGAVKLWEIETGNCLAAIRTESMLKDCDVFPDGKRLVAVGEAGMHWLEIVGG